MYTIEFNKKEMMKALTLLSKFVDRKRNTLPILQYVLITQYPRETRLTVVNNGETGKNTWARYVLPTAATQKEAPPVLVYFRDLKDTTSTLVNPVFEVTDTQEFYVKDTTTRIRMLTLPLEEFPACPDFPAYIFSFNRNFSDAINSVFPAVSSDFAREILTHINVFTQSGELWVEGCDGMKLIRKTVESVSQDIKWLIPYLAAKVIATRSLPCSLSVEKDCFFYSDYEAHYCGLDIIAQVPEGGSRYPDTNQVLPYLQDTDTRLVFTPKDWTAPLNQVVKTLKLAEHEYSIKLTANTGLHVETGDDLCTLDLPAEIVNIGENPTIGVNPINLLQSISNIPADKPTTIQWAKKVAPITVKQGKDLLAVVMPMYLSE